MIRPVIRSLIVAAGLAWAGCGVEPEPSASTPDPEAASSPDRTGAVATPRSELAQAGAPSGEAIQPRTTCGFDCHAPTGDILEVSWNFCLHACPGGPSNCTPMPPPPCP